MAIKANKQIKSYLDVRDGVKGVLDISALHNEKSCVFNLGHDETMKVVKLADIVCDEMNLEKPIIAAVNGYALGGGFEIALACDIILASKNAIFALPEVRVGLIAGAGGIQRLIRQIGRASALEMIYTGRHVKADEALRLGIVAKVVEQKDLLKCARNLAKQIIAVSPSSVKATKKVINSMDKDAKLGESLAFTRDVVSTLKNTDDFKEGVNAFVEKRKPVWKNC